MDYSDRLKAKDWVVRPVEISIARRFIQKYHYAKGASNTGTYIHGLFRVNSLFDEEVMGVAWWIPPTKSAAHSTYPENWRGVLALSRLAIAPETPKNACTFLLAGSRKLIDRTLWPCLVTYADDWRGHSGGIYKADNWEYVGKTKAERTYVIDGVMVSRKAGQKTRTHSEMLAMGAEMVGSHWKHKFVQNPKTSPLGHKQG